jgi:hypothetical protein
MLATIFYEDSLAVQTKNFGLHVLILHCVADRLPITVEELDDLFEGNPRKGATNILKLFDDPHKERLHGSSPHVLAVYDRDKIHEFVNTEGRCKSIVRQAILARCQWTAKPVVVLLEDNAESVAEAILALQQKAPLAGRKPRPGERDKIFLSAAWNCGPDFRRALLKASPSLRYIVDKLEVLGLSYLETQ